MAAKPLNLAGVPNLDAMLKEARRLGCDVAYGNGGEVRVAHPEYPARMNLNSRRKDGTRALRKMLQVLQRNEA